MLVHPDRRPIAAQVAVLDLERRDDAGLQPLQLHQVRFAIVRVHDLRERERQQLVVVVADDAAERRVALLEAPLAIGDRHAQRGVLDDAAEAALDDAQGAGGALLLGAIEHVIDEQADGAGRVDDGHDAVAHQLAVAGVAADQLDVEVLHVFAPGGPARRPVLDRHQGAVGMAQLEPAGVVGERGQHLGLGGETVDAQRFGVEGDRGAGRIGDADADRQVIEDGAQRRQPECEEALIAGRRRGGGAGSASVAPTGGRLPLGMDPHYARPASSAIRESRSVASANAARSATATRAGGPGSGPASAARGR